MKSIVEQYNACRFLETAESESPSIPVLGRLSRSPVKRLGRCYRDGVPVVMLVSHSRFAPGYVLDRFIAAIDSETTVIRVEQTFDDPAALMDHIVRSVGFESRAMSLSHLDHAFGLFLQYQKTRRLRTILAVRDIDAQGRQVQAKVCDLIDMELATVFGLMVVTTGPANDPLEPDGTMLEAISRRAATRIVLTPFVLSETREFIRDRFGQRAANGANGGRVVPGFEVYATQLIHELSAGVPETVDLLCRESTEIAARNGNSAVSTTEVKAAARLVGLLPAAADDDELGTVLAADVAGDSPGQLIIKVQGAPEKKMALNGSKVLIGRDRLCDVCVEDAQVSRLHGLIARAAEGVYYLDLGSTNGSAVNGEAAQRLVLANNDVIAVGDVRIIYTSKGAVDTDDVDLDATDTFAIPKFDPHAFANGGNGTGARRKS
jgi:hypothetical protein